ncbi:uncharacterized protein SOCEGT47_083260 [Sorangium cellulosum]|uniref:DUF2283 domain-containing protein n=1 Tax=Sorangium cellulosum TaxID=56 RepID=A0A4P2QE92_SORCE|nr:DUF2283 domain-containing protein [Sorangium cellulosum]AUX27728.1 uncharacterized protein SOCEGT47_083260 [Sorangium cellulosum]
MSESESKLNGGGFELRVSEDDADVAYLRLPSHPGTSPCKMSKSVRLRDLIGNYEGPDVVLDFDLRGVLVGIEVLA